MKLQLRPVMTHDIPLFFTQQRDPVARQQVAYVVANPDDWPTFQEKWEKILRDGAATVRTIVVDEVVVGNVLCHQWFGRPEVGYWIDRHYWGQGIATQALTELLLVVTARPLYAFVACDNLASLRVLQKCGFTVCGQAKEYSNARVQEVEATEWVLHEVASTPATV